MFFGLVLRLYLVRLNDFRLHQAHLIRLEKGYANQSITPVDDRLFYDFDLDPSVKLNEIQMLATHNSYKKKGVLLGKLLVGLGDSFDEAKALNYGYQSLHDQLMLGIRSFEWDVRLRKTAFELNHVPLVDNSSVAPNFEKALQEMLMFTHHNPNHLPIILLIEIKDDWMILDHALQTIGLSELKHLNLIIEQTMGDHVYRPSEMIGDYRSLKEAIQQQGWPSVSELLGKYLFILHPGNKTDLYLSIDPTVFDLVMFPGIYKDRAEEEYAAFVVHNEVDVLSIQQLVDQGLIVRTRIDSGLSFDAQRFLLAMESGAQLLTSDFLIGRSDLPIDQVIYFDGQKTVRKRS